MCYIHYYISIYQLLESFTKGINFYIKSLKKDKYPIEYKIFDYEPELWNPLKTSLLFVLLQL